MYCNSLGFIERSTSQLTKGFIEAFINLFKQSAIIVT